MNETPSYTELPGNRWGMGSDSVLRYLLSDLAKKPGTHPPAPAPRWAGMPLAPAN